MNARTVLEEALETAKTLEKIGGHKPDRKKIAWIHFGLAQACSGSGDDETAVSIFRRV